LRRYGDRRDLHSFPTRRSSDLIAGAWVELMNRLSYDEFLAHGGDWGGVVTTVLGGLFPERVIGIHSTLAQAPTGLSTDGLTDQRSEEHTSELQSRENLVCRLLL